MGCVSVGHCVTISTTKTIGEKNLEELRQPSVRFGNVKSNLYSPQESRKETFEIIIFLFFLGGGRSAKECTLNYRGIKKKKLFLQY